MTCARENGFRVNLSAFDYIFSVPDTHYLPFFCLCGDFQAGWEVLLLDDEGVVTTCKEGILYSPIDGFAIVSDDG